MLAEWFVIDVQWTLRLLSGLGLGVTCLEGNPRAPPTACCADAVDAAVVDAAAARVQFTQISPSRLINIPAASRAAEGLPLRDVRLYRRTHTDV